MQCARGTTKKSTPKGACLWSRNLFKFLVPPTISLERLKLYRRQILYSGLPGGGLALDYKLSLEWSWSRSRDIFKFSEISDNISEMVQDRDIVAMKDK